MTQNNKDLTPKQKKLVQALLNTFPMNAEPATDKAKKILFGRTDIGDNKIDLSERKIFSNDEKKFPETESKWHDPEMTGPVDTFGIKVIEDTLGIVGENEFKALTPEQEAAYERMQQITGDLWTKEDTKKAIENIEFVKPVLDGKMFDGEKFDAANIEDELRFPRPASIQPIASGEPELTYKFFTDFTDKSKMETMLQEVEKIYAYCTAQNISPDQLIKDHKDYNDLIATLKQVRKYENK